MYIELHSRTAFNFLRSAVQPDVLAAAAARCEMPALAALDRDGVYGAPAFHVATREVGVRALVGAELTMADGAVVPLLVENQQGYRNLARLITEAQLRAPKGAAAVTWRELSDYKEGLIALTGDVEGPLLRGWCARGVAGMRAGLRQLLKVFDQEAVYVEVQRHCLRAERHYNQALVDLAGAHGLPLVATNGVAYVQQQGRKVMDVFTCLRHHTTLDKAGRLLSANDEAYLKTSDVMQALFADLPQAVINTRRLADRLTFTMADLGYRFPDFPVPAGETMDTYLAKVTWEGARTRYKKINIKVRRQLEHELAIIQRLGFSGYFLIVWDIIKYCRQNRIMVQGRGSAANSAVCFSLGLTAFDPVRHHLLFERFLSEGRHSWPDIDFDLPSGEQREQVIQEVYRRYGEHGAAMTANVITYRGRSAMREIGKVVGLADDVVERFNALLSRGDYPHTLDMQDQLKKAGIDIRHAQHRAAVDLYNSILGLPRHLGQHSGGMLICKDELSSIVPFENASMPGRVVAQWDKEACEDMGIVKIDFLGLGMMAVLKEAIELTHAQGQPVDMAHIPKDDAATYDLMCRAETMGVFQIESRAQMATLPRMQPRTFYDLVVEVALIRPGPIAGNLTHPYLNRRNGIEPIDYIDAKLKPVLERTLGVPLFQEQVLKMAMVMADFTPAEAEALRRALGFQRNAQRMLQVKKQLIAKLRTKRVEEHKIERIADAVSSFALYGFPESHAISFALLSYTSAYLKVHHREAFYTALLNNQPMGFYAPSTIIHDAQRYGLKFLPPCVLQSDWNCRIVAAGVIRLGVKLIRGVNQRAVAHMLAARRERVFHTLTDFKLRTQLAKDELRALARSGALNGLAKTRRQALWAIETPLPPGDLFTAVAEPEGVPQDFALPEMNYWERICADYATTALTTKAHPMKLLRKSIKGKVLTAAELNHVENNRRAAVAGAVICRQRPGTAKGVVFISLEDETGVANCVVWGNLFEKVRLTIVQEAYLLLTGKVQRVEGVTHLIVRKVHPLFLEDAPEAMSHDFY